MSDHKLVVFVPKMMPGQDPYTPEEAARVRKLIADAAAANVTEQDEIGMLSCTSCRRPISGPAYNDPNHQLCGDCYDREAERDWADR